MADSSVNTGIWQSYTESLTNEPAAKTRSTNTELGKDAFLSLLITQLQYQDPMNPTDDKQFLAEMAQFTALEQMQNLNKTMAQSHSYSMIGKYVTTVNYDKLTNSYEQVTGIVDAVKVTKQGTMLVINGKDVDPESVTTVSQIDTGYSNAQNLALIGKYVQALIIENGKATEFVEGKVDNIKFVEGNTILVIGDKEILPGEVLSVSDQMMLLGKTMSATIKDSVTQEESTITGVVEGIKIKNQKPYVTIGNTDVPISMINYLTDAIKTVGTNVNFKDVSGKVSGVIIKNQLPYLQVGDKEISFTDYKGISTQ